MIKIIKTIDLNTNLLYSDNLIKFYRSFYGIDALGIYINKLPLIQNLKENVIFRINSDKKNNFGFMHDKIRKPLLTSSTFTGNVVDNFYNADILTVKNLNNITALLKKHRGKNIGIEFLISDVKHLDNNDFGKWIYDLKWIYYLCKKYKFQFILASGANIHYELVSLKVFNILLEKIDINFKDYWTDIINWLDDKKVTLYYDTS
jgi:hypothetical protein